MHVLGRRRGTLGAALLLAAFAFAPAPALAKPAPDYKPQGFRLFSRAAFRWVGNRVQCFLSSTGQICTAESSVIGGGYWPAGTNNQYIFNTGLQVAGIVDSNSVGNPWRGNIDGAFFFNARGGQSGQGLTNVFNSSDAADLAAWPTAAYVPTPPDPQANLFDPALQGAKTASDNDVWFMSWEGDPNISTGRNHPLGLAVETRGLAYATPGKNDFLFFIYTFYNVTSANAADYANTPARLRDSLVAFGQRFQALNNAKLGTPLPVGGYSITDMFLAFGADMDVTSEDAGSNYDGVNVPMSLGYTYHKSFTAQSSWTFDPTIYAAPFFPGAGFIGVKYLKSPEVNGVERGLTLFGATTNGGEFSDPRNTAALYRYLTGNLDPSQGDNSCNVGNVQITKICYINQGAAADMRFFQASGPLTLAPGEFSSIAVAYVFAPPVASGACTGPDVCSQVRPQDPTGSLTRMLSPDSIVLGVNTVDTITGYLGYQGDVAPADGLINENEIDVVPGSLLGKAKSAQSIFNSKFVQPAAPKSPQYFLVPGDQQVTIVWQPSTSEALGDPYFAAAQQGATYDPNYRQFDVAGYRIYRGLRSDESSLQLIAQFDKTGDVMQDFTGQINQMDAQGFTDCAPPLGVFISCTSAGQNNGVDLIDPIDISLDGPVVQYQSVIPSGTHAYATKADTALSGGNTGLAGLSGTGVPFLFTDRAGNCTRCGVRNHTRYFYVVTAFDINSIRSGPSSLESNRSGPKNTTPQPTVTNASSSGSIAAVVTGRGVVLTDNVDPTIDPATGRFNKPFPPANGATLSLAGFLPNLLGGSGAAKMELDSVGLGSAYTGTPVTYYWTASSGGDTTRFVFPIQQAADDAEASAGAFFPAVPLSQNLSKKYGGSKAFKLFAKFDQVLPGNYETNSWGRGCVNGGAGFGAACDYNGSRWFDGPSPQNNETKVDPVAGNAQNFTSPFQVDRTQPNNGGWNNAGELTGVSVIHQDYSYQTMGNQWRDIEGNFGGAKRAADYNVYWNAATAGLIDSVIDVTHNVPVAFKADFLGSSYGVLNQSAALPSAGSFDNRTELTSTDFGCIEPLRSDPAAQTRIACTAPAYVLSQQASIGPIAFWDVSPATSQTSAFTGTGFGFYIAGNLFTIQTATLPQGTVWSLRDYVGAISGGNGFGGNDGPYSFVPQPRPFNAVGAAVEVQFNVSNTVAAITKGNLDQVHTVPDPYYVTHSLEQSSDQKIIKFVNLPTRAIIRIYSASGVLVRVLEQNTQAASELTWDVRNRNGQFVASGVYFYHIESGAARRVGRMTIVNFAK